MKKRFDLTSYGVQEITVAEAYEINGGSLSQVTRWFVENVSYALHSFINGLPTAEEALNNASKALHNSGKVGII